MDNPIIQTDLVQVLDKLDNKFDRLETKIDKLDEKIDNLEIGQTEIKGNIKALKVKTEQLDKRMGNVEFGGIRGILIGLIVFIFGGFAMFFWTSNKL